MKSRKPSKRRRWRKIQEERKSKYYHPKHTKQREREVQAGLVADDQQEPV